MEENLYKIPIAEEFRTEQNILPDLSLLKSPDGLNLNGNQRIERLMIEFAKLHVKAALTSAHKNMQLPIEDLEFTLQSYYDENIK